MATPVLVTPKILQHSKVGGLNNVTYTENGKQYNLNGITDAEFYDKFGGGIAQYEEGSAIKEALKLADADYRKRNLEKGIADNKVAKAEGIGSLALNAGAGILGLGQAIGGAKVLGKLKAPKYPYEQLPNQELSARLGDVQRLAQIGDPVIREKMLRDMSMQNAKNDAIAKISSGGDISSYAAQSQANATANNDAIRNIGASELAFKTQQGGILDNLIQQKINEDNARQKGRIDKFNNVDMPEFKAKRNYGEQLVNKGIGNLFSAGKGVSEGATILQRTGQNTDQFNRQQAELDKQAGLPNINTITTPVSSIGLSKLIPTSQDATMALQGINPKNVSTPLVKPTWYDTKYKSQKDMQYMDTPEGYQQYKKNLSTLTPEQITTYAKGIINPKTGKKFTDAEIPVLIKGMTDGKIGSSHRLAQDILNEVYPDASRVPQPIQPIGLKTIPYNKIGSLGL